MRTFARCFLAFPLLVVACGGESQPPPQAPSTSSAAGSTGGDDGEAQASRGAKLYSEHCATCHGGSGEGGKGPTLVGKDGKDALPLDPRPDQKLRKAQFHTALDVGQWVAQNMPPNGPKLTEKEYWDILAFDLKANGVPVAGKHIDASTAGSIKLH
jgi:cytochrome c